MKKTDQPLKSRGGARSKGVVRSSDAVRGRNRIADLADAVHDHFAEAAHDHFAKVERGAAWIPKSWKRMTARRLVIATGIDHYWNFHKRSEPGCPVCWEQVRTAAHKRTTHPNPQTISRQKLKR